MKPDQSFEVGEVRIEAHGLLSPLCPLTVVVRCRRCEKELSRKVWTRQEFMGMTDSQVRMATAAAFRDATKSENHKCKDN